jgi:GT2 family glycosyltransferase
LAATSAPWVALLNADTHPEPDWLRALLDAAAAPGTAAVASCMVFAHRPDMVNSAGIACDEAGIAWDRLGGADVTTAAVPGAVFGASAGAALYRRAALEDVAEPNRTGRMEVFDEGFFMYLEDVDLAWRLRLRGWDAVYAPAARVAHVGSATAGEGSAFKNRLLARNKVWTVLKNYPGRPLAMRLPLVLAYDLASAPYRAVAARQAAALTGRLAAVRHPGDALRRRRRIQARRTVSWRELSEVMEGWTAPWKVPARYVHLAAPGAAGGLVEPR